MVFESWRGTVGVIKPTRRPGSTEEFIRLMPAGVGVVSEFMDTRHGTTKEFESALDAIDPKVRLLVEVGVDLVHPEGSPVSTILGFRKEQEFVNELEERHGVPVATSGMTQVEAMKALGMQRILSITRGGSQLREAKLRYLADAGFDVAAMEDVEVPFERLGQFSDREFYTHAKAAFMRHEEVDGIHIFGSGWRLLNIVETLENDLGVPVVYPVPARVWALQLRLRVRHAVAGYGRLLEEMPRFAT